jgi:excisionase family DNA binding protein
MTVTDKSTCSPLLSVAEAAELLGISHSAIYRSIKRGDLPLPLITISGRWRIPRRAVEQLIEGSVAAVAEQRAAASEGG